MGRCTVCRVAGSFSINRGRMLRFSRFPGVIPFLPCGGLNQMENSLTCWLRWVQTRGPTTPRDRSLCERSRCARDDTSKAGAATSSGREWPFNNSRNALLSQRSKALRHPKFVSCAGIEFAAWRHGQSRALPRKGVSKWAVGSLRLDAGRA